MGWAGPTDGNCTQLPEIHTNKNVVGGNVGGLTALPILNSFQSLGGYRLIGIVFVEHTCFKVGDGFVLGCVAKCEFWRGF